jgi:hypothetical protein
VAIYNPSGSGNVHIDVVLTGISVAWPNEGLVGNVLFPAVPVQKQSDKYYVFAGREGWYPALDDARAPGTEANEVPGLEVSLGSYYCQEHALQIAVTDEERENADSPLSPDVDGTEMLASRVALGKEYRIFKLVSTAANYHTDPGTDYNNNLTVDLSSPGGSGYPFYEHLQWDNATGTNQLGGQGPTPVQDIRQAFRSVHGVSFLTPNSAIIPYLVMSYLEDTPDFVERIKYSERAILTPDLVSSLLSLDNVVVPGFGYATNNPGQTLALQYLWQNQVLLTYSPPRPGLKVPAFAYQFTWGFGGGGGGSLGFGSGAFSGQGINDGQGLRGTALNPTDDTMGTDNALGGGIVDRWREERRASDVIRFRQRYDLELIGVDSSGKSICGFLFQNAIAATS